jgi:hypothetical protein
MATSRRLILTTTRSPSALQRIVVLCGRRQCTITRAHWDVDSGSGRLCVDVEGDLAVIRSLARRLSARVAVVDGRGASCGAIGALGVEAKPEPVQRA